MITMVTLNEVFCVYSETHKTLNLDIYCPISVNSTKILHAVPTQSDQVNLLAPLCYENTVTLLKKKANCLFGHSESEAQNETNLD